MTKLKTLKDLNLFNDDLKDDIAKEKLKAEAVKWVKHFNIQHNNHHEEWDLRCSAFGVINAFIDFFNLTEEDLKGKEE